MIMHWSPIPTGSLGALPIQMHTQSRLSWVAMVQRARARRETKRPKGPKGRQNGPGNSRKELIQPPPRKRRRDETQGQGQWQ